MIYNRASQRSSGSAVPPATPQALDPLPPRVTDGTGFDYIVVGAGAAGCALVDRLLADGADRSVLLLEAGPPNAVPEIQDFTQAMNLRGTVYDWNDKSQPQAHMNDELMPYDSGHASGGGTSINGMVWVRGHQGDYDGWAAAGCTGWDYASVLPVFERQEAYAGVSPGPTRGTTGPVATTNALSINPISKDFVSAMVAAGLSFNEDYNDGEQTGVAFTQLNVQPTTPQNGRRQDAFSTFVAPYVQAKDPRLTVVNGALVEQIDFDAQGAVTQVAFSYAGVPQWVPVLQEAIVCAGTLRTPQILMLSGIGDPDQLAALGVELVHANPAVGQNLHDQLIPFVAWSMARPDPGHFTAMDNNVFWGTDGPGGASTYEVQTFYMVDAPGFPPLAFGLGAIVLHPTSRGQVTLASRDPKAAPLIQPNLLATDEDLAASLKGLKMVRSMAKAFVEAGNGWLDAEVLPGPSVVTDEQLIAYIRAQAVPDFHYVGSCRMGGDAASVVDPTCRVRGVTGLRVADASIMPQVTSGNTNAPSMMIGGRCGDFIIAETTTDQD